MRTRFGAAFATATRSAPHAIVCTASGESGNPSGNNPGSTGPATPTASPTATPATAPAVSVVSASSAVRGSVVKAAARVVWGTVTTSR